MTAASQPPFVRPTHPPWQDHTHRLLVERTWASEEPFTHSKCKRNKSAAAAVRDSLYSSPPKHTIFQWMDIPRLPTNTFAPSSALCSRSGASRATVKQSILLWSLACFPTTNTLLKRIMLVIAHFFKTLLHISRSRICTNRDIKQWANVSFKHIIQYWKKPVMCVPVCAQQDGSRQRCWKETASHL